MVCQGECFNKGTIEQQETPLTLLIKFSDFYCKVGWRLGGKHQNVNQAILNRKTVKRNNSSLKELQQNDNAYQ
jgi:hypothetical protein